MTINVDKVQLRHCRKHGVSLHYKTSRACTLCAAEHGKARYQRMKAALAAVGNISPPQPTAVDDGKDLI